MIDTLESTFFGELKTHPTMMKQSPTNTSDTTETTEASSVSVSVSSSQRTKPSSDDGDDSDFFFYDIDVSRRNFSFTDPIALSFLCAAPPDTTDRQQQDHANDENVNGETTLYPTNGSAALDISSHRATSRRHSIAGDTSHLSQAQLEQLQLEQHHIRLKLKHAELLTTFDQVAHKMTKSCTENTHLREQVEDVLEERDAALDEVEEMKALVESFRSQMKLMEKEKCTLKKRLGEYEGNKLLVDF